MPTGIFVRTEEHKRKTSKSLKRYYSNPENKIKMSGKNCNFYIDGRCLKWYYCIDCGKELSDYRAKRCRSCASKEISNRPEVREKVLKGRLTQARNYISKIELKVKRQLKENNINFIHQYKLDNFLCDFYLPKYNLLIEVDGNYWHNLPGRKETDEKKNKCARENNYNIIRIWESEINKDDFNIMNYLKEFKIELRYSF